MSLVGQTIDVENCSQLIALVRYRHGGTIMEDLLFFNSEDNQQNKRHLQKGEELFLKTWPIHPSYWFCVYESAPAMVGNK